MADITSDLIHHWTFNNTLACRITGELFTGTYNTDYTYVTDGQLSGKAASIVVNKKLTSDDNTTGNFADNQAWSVAFWCRFRTNPTTSNYYLVAKKGGGGASLPGFMFYNNSSGATAYISFLVADGTYRAYCLASTVGVFTQGQWHHIVGTFDPVGNVMSLAMDGSIKIVNATREPGGTPLSTFGAFADNSVSLQAGSTTAAAGTEMDIQDLRIYNRAFVIGDITELYAYEGINYGVESVSSSLKASINGFN